MPGSHAAELERALGPLAAAVTAIPDDLKLLTPERIASVTRELAEAGAEVWSVGRSREGREINALVAESPDSDPKRNMVLWGYPHPDEPLGASWLPTLLTQQLRGELGGLEEWRIVVVLCADPDNARRQSWMGELTLPSFARGAFRPTHLSWEADYGFPIDWGPFYQTPDWRGRCRTLTECYADPECATFSPLGPWECSRANLPPGPLPESMALVEVMSRWPPDLVVSLHNTHTGGDYTFLLHPEKRSDLLQLRELPELAGRGRHLGEPIDRGARWLRDAPDLLHEKTLARKEKRLQKMPGFDPAYRYAGNASVANWIEALDRRVQFTCPETTVFYHPAFSDSTPINQTERAMVEIARGKRAQQNFYQFERVLIDGEWVVARQHKLANRSRAQRSERRELPLTRASLAVRALTLRRAALTQADLIWRELLRAQTGELRPHPYYDERQRMTVPGEAVGDGAALIFRTRSDYGEPPTEAQRASFEWIWPIHTASLLANFSSYLRAQSPEPAVRAAREKLDELIATQTALAPPELQTAAAVGSAARSVAARVLYLALIQPS